MSHILSTINKKYLYIILFSSLIFTILTKEYITNFISGIDPRVDIYMNYKDDYYGNPVSDFGQLFFIFVLMFISIFGYILTNDNFFKKFALNSYAGILIFIAFSDFGIFSYRLAHLTTIFYPFMIAKIYYSDSYNIKYKLVNNYNIAMLALFSSFVVLFVGLRSGNYEIIRNLVPFYIES
jgi:hypothetical protein